MQTCLDRLRGYIMGFLIFEDRETVIHALATLVEELENEE